MKNLMLAMSMSSLLWSSSLLAAETAAPAASSGVDKETVALLQKSACLNCHTLVKKPAQTKTELSFGPPYLLVAARYRDDKQALETLFSTVRHGSNPYGKHWKDESSGIAMPPMVTVSDENIKKLLTWILALDETKAKEAEAFLAEEAAEPAKATEKK